MRRSKGFTLIELLAVIVILGVIMLIAIPSVTGYITNSRKSSFATNGQYIIDAVRNYAITNNGLPTYDGQAVAYRVVDDDGNIAVKLDSGGTKSAFGGNWVANYNYVVIKMVGTNYEYYYTGYDTKGNYVPLTLEENLSSKVVATASSVSGGIDSAITKYPTEFTGDGTTGTASFSVKIGSDTLAVTAYQELPNEGDIIL